MDSRRVVALDIAATQEGVVTRDQARRAVWGVPLGAVPLHVTVDVSAAHPSVIRLAIETGERAFVAVRVHRFRSAGEPLLTLGGVRCTDAARRR